jgi:hypothetical protein
VTAIVLIVYRFIDPPPDVPVSVAEYEIDIEWGAWSALAAAVIITVASFAIYIERRRIRRADEAHRASNG